MANKSIFIASRNVLIKKLYKCTRIEVLFEFRRLKMIVHVMRNLKEGKYSVLVGHDPDLIFIPLTKETAKEILGERIELPYIYETSNWWIRNSCPSNFLVGVLSGPNNDKSFNLVIGLNKWRI